MGCIIFAELLSLHGRCSFVSLAKVIGMKKRENWIKPRHRIVLKIVRVLLKPYCRWKYGIKADFFPDQKNRPYLILMNHQTPFDQFFVGIAFPEPVYYMASEDIFSNGWVSSLIRWLVAPIPIKKQTTDISAVMTCLRVAREGASIAIAPEGNRTYSGRTEYMNPAIAGLARKMRLPIALFRIEGGYGVQPRWSDGTRKGKIHAYVSQVIEPEEYAAMSADELAEKIRIGLQVDEAVADGLFKSNKRAEYLERAVYVCPYCGLSKWESHGNEAECTTCRRKILYGEDKRISGVGFDFPFPFMAQWYEYQMDFVNSLDVMQHLDAPLFRDTADLWEVILNKQKKSLRKGSSVSLYGDRVVVDEGREVPGVFPFEEVTAVTVLGRNKLNIYHNNMVYQFKGGKRFNALKYVNIYYRHKNIIRGEKGGKFLGL